MSGHDFFFVEFRSVVRGYHVYKEFGHLYWVSNCPPCSVCALQQYTIDYRATTYTGLETD